MMFKKKRAVSFTAMAAGAAMLLTGCAGGGGGPAETLDPNEAITLNFAFWGNEDRAKKYEEAFAAFNEDYPNITVNTSFLDFPSFWEKRQTEAAGGGLPDVMQFDYSYLRQYAENGLLLDLDPYLGGAIDASTFEESILEVGKVADVTYALPTGTNAWALFQNVNLAEEVTGGPFEGGAWEDLTTWSDGFTTAAGGEKWGTRDYGEIIQNFELQLRAEGSNLFTEEGEPGFDEARLAEFWKSSQELRDGAGMKASKAAEFDPVGPMPSGVVGAELNWDNFGSSYLAQLPEQYQSLAISAPPVTVEGAKDLYLKPSMLHAAASNTDHPEAAAVLIDFLVNDERVSEIFGTSRGLPASEVQLAAAELDGLNAQIKDYQESIVNRLGDAPPAPVVGFGSLEEQFRVLGQELGFGTITPEEASKRFFTEMNVVLGN